MDATLALEVKIESVSEADTPLSPSKEDVHFFRISWTEHYRFAPKVGKRGNPNIVLSRTHPLLDQIVSFQ